MIKYLQKCEGCTSSVRYCVYMYVYIYIYIYIYSILLFEHPNNPSIDVSGKLFENQLRIQIHFSEFFRFCETPEIESGPAHGLLLYTYLLMYLS